MMQICLRSPGGPAPRPAATRPRRSRLDLGVVLDPARAVTPSASPSVSAASVRAPERSQSDAPPMRTATFRRATPATFRRPVREQPVTLRRSPVSRMTTQVQPSTVPLAPRAAVPAPPASRREVRGGRRRAGCGVRRRGQDRPDAALHGVGLGDLAPGRRRDRRAVPVGHALVARRVPRRDRRQRRAARHASGRQPGRPAGRQHGRDPDRRRCCCAACAGRAPRSTASTRSRRCSPWPRWRRRSAPPWARHRCSPAGSSSRARRSRSGGPGRSGTRPARSS